MLAGAGGANRLHEVRQRACGVVPFTSDPSTVIACTGGCAQTWSPATSSEALPAQIADLPGTLSVLSSAHGRQVHYNGHALHRYRGDSQPGQTNEQGIGGRWFVAQPTLATGTPTSTDSGYGANG